MKFCTFFLISIEGKAKYIAIFCSLQIMKIELEVLTFYGESINFLLKFLTLSPALVNKWEDIDH